MLPTPLPGRGVSEQTRRRLEEALGIGRSERGSWAGHMERRMMIVRDSLRRDPWRKYVGATDGLRHPRCALPGVRSSGGDHDVAPPRCRRVNGCRWRDRCGEVAAGGRKVCLCEGKRRTRLPLLGTPNGPATRNPIRGNASIVHCRSRTHPVATKDCGGCFKVEGTLRSTQKGLQSTRGWIKVAPHSASTGSNLPEQTRSLSCHCSSAFHKQLLCTHPQPVGLCMRKV